MKAIVVTGTSSGLGRALFDLLCEQECDLFCLSRRFLDYQVELSQNNKHIRLVNVDLSVLSSVQSVDLVSLIDPGRYDEIIFVNNAGIIEPIGLIGSIDDRKLMQSVHVNFASPLILINSLLRNHKNCKLRVLNISSGASNRPISGWALYCSTKAATRMFCDVLKEENPEIEVYNIDPGVVDTSMQQTIRASSIEDFPQRTDFVRLKETGKLRSPDEVVETIVRSYMNL